MRPRKTESPAGLQPKQRDQTWPRCAAVLERHWQEAALPKEGEENPARFCWDQEGVLLEYGLRDKGPAILTCHKRLAVYTIQKNSVCHRHLVAGLLTIRAPGATPLLSEKILPRIQHFISMSHQGKSQSCDSDRHVHMFVHPTRFHAHFNVQLAGMQSEVEDLFLISISWHPSATVQCRNSMHLCGTPYTVNSRAILRGYIRTIRNHPQHKQASIIMVT